MADVWLAKPQDFIGSIDTLTKQLQSCACGTQTSGDVCATRKKSSKTSPR